MSPFTRLAGLLCLGVLAPTVMASTQASRPENPSQGRQEVNRPTFALPEKSNGEAALQRLKASGKLPEFAAFYGFTESEVNTLFRNDATAYLDQSGALLYIEPPASTGEINNQPNSGPNNPTIPLSQTFELESKPNSPRTIYLDFNGHTITNTAWNSSYGISTINNPAYDLDGSPGTFSTDELIAIQDIWRQVAEDFAPFDVNITTKLVDESVLTRSSSSDTQFGVRVVITTDFTKNTASPCSCGGFAYIGVFDSVGDYYKPAYVFINNLSRNTKYIAEAASHEAGHTVGLRHDGNSIRTYYNGHGSGETAWAPIMGVGYYKPLVQWSKGEYLDASNQEDDYLVMQNNSLYFDADDFADSTAQAGVAELSDVNGFAQGSWQGTLQGPNDIDWVALNVGAGLLTIEAQPFIRYPNVDISLVLTDADGATVASSNPSDTLNSTLQFNVPLGGRYYLAIDGTGKGDPLGTGYTDYGSIGLYTISVQGQLFNSGPVAPLAVAEASVTAGEAPLPVSFSAENSYDLNGDIVSYQWTFGDGSSASGVSVTYTYRQAGNFTASLVVTDSTGLSDTADINITVNEPQPLPAVSVGSINLEGVVATGKGRKPTEYSANALVEVVDDAGVCVADALVNVSWGGVVSGNAQAITSCSTTDGGGGKGRKNKQTLSGVGAAFSSPKSTQSGTFTITVDGITLDGFEFAPSTNDQSSVNVF